MHALYKQKKTLLLVALCCMNSLGSFMSATKALPTESISEHYKVPALEELPEKIQMRVKGKEKEYGKLLAYYTYSFSWLGLSLMIPLTVACGILTVFCWKKFEEEAKKMPQNNQEMGNQAVYCVLFLVVSLLSLYLSISIFRKARNPGAIFLTDTGVLFIDYGPKGKQEFISYEDIKEVRLQKFKHHETIEITFVKNFSDYERAGVKYNGKVNKLSIEPAYMQDGLKGTSAYKDLHKTLSEMVGKAHIKVIRERAKQETTQEKGKSLLEIKKEQEKFSKASEELREKSATVQASHSGLFTQIEGYYPSKISPLFKVCVGLAIVMVGIIVIMFLTAERSQKPPKKPYSPQNDDLDPKALLVGLLAGAGVLLLMVIYNLYDSYMHPAGLFMTDTGVLYIEEGRKLKYTFVRYEDVKEILRDVNNQVLLINSTQSTHNASSKMNGAEPQTLKISFSDMDKEVMDVLYEHLQLKTTALKEEEEEEKLIEA